MADYSGVIVRLSQRTGPTTFVTKASAVTDVAGSFTVPTAGFSSTLDNMWALTSDPQGRYYSEPLAIGEVGPDTTGTINITLTAGGGISGSATP